MEKNEILQEAINKYTTGLLPQTSVSAGSVFKSFYHDLVLGKTEITFPNTRKTTHDLQTLFNRLWNGNFEEFLFGGEKLYEKKNTFSYPRELKRDNDRKEFLDALKKDVIFLYAAFLQSFLIEQEQKEKVGIETKLYRLQGHIKEVTDKYVHGEIVCTDRFTSTTRPENGKTFLERDETFDGQHYMSKKEWEEVTEMKITITKPKNSACGVHLPENGAYYTGFPTYQREVLLPIGTCFKITEKKFSNDPLLEMGLKNIISVGKLLPSLL